MPFELGVAYALSRDNPDAVVLVFEATKRNLLKTLSDLRHFDPKIHGMNGKKALASIYDSFVSPDLPDPEELGFWIYKKAMKNLPMFRKKQRTIFNKRSFSLLVHSIKSWWDLLS